MFESTGVPASGTATVPVAFFTLCSPPFGRQSGRDARGPKAGA